MSLELPVDNSLMDQRYDTLPDLAQEYLQFRVLDGSTSDEKIMILWGEDDPVSLDVAKAMKAALTGAQVELIVIEECGHFWQERPQEFLAQIRAFLIKKTPRL